MTRNPRRQFGRCRHPWCRRSATASSDPADDGLCDRHWPRIIERRAQEARDRLERAISDACSIRPMSTSDLTAEVRHRRADLIAAVARMTAAGTLTASPLPSTGGRPAVVYSTSKARNRL